MRNILFLFLLCPMLAFGETGHLTVEMKVGCTLSEGNYLNFGYPTVVGAATITITPSGVRSTTGNVVFDNQVFSTNNYTVTGSPLETYIVTLPASATLTNGKTTITVTDFRTSLNSNLGTLDSKGYGIFSVGATMTIPNGTTSGVYNGSYTITAQYQ